MFFYGTALIGDCFGRGVVWGRCCFRWSVCGLCYHVLGFICVCWLFVLRFSVWRCLVLSIVHGVGRFGMVFWFVVVCSFMVLVRGMV